MEHYYLPLRFMAIRDKNQQFSALAKRIEQTVPEKLLGYLVYFLEDNYYFNSLPSPLPMNYTKEFKHSNLVRIRRGDIDASILGGNPTFFTLSKGNAVLASVRLASAFFGRGQFKSKWLLSWHSEMVEF